MSVGHLVRQSNHCAVHVVGHVVRHGGLTPHMCGVGLRVFHWGGLVTRGHSCHNKGGITQQDSTEELHKLSLRLTVSRWWWVVLQMHCWTALLDC
jgi:hypothetical protein